MSKSYGVDFGTAFFQIASMGAKNEIETKIARNAFVEMETIDGIEDILKQNNWNSIKDGNQYFVVGEDALRVAKMFPGKVEMRRPMADGVLNKNEEKKMIVLSHLLESMVGKAQDNKSVICTCISSPSVDGTMDSEFHKSRLIGMIKRLGFVPKVIEEGLAVVLAERPTATDTEGKDVPYTGTGISFGGGRTNVVLAYKGVPITGFSCVRGGDWIDKKVSEATDTPISQVISYKEKELDFTKLDYDNDIAFALDTYHSELVKFIFNKLSEKFMTVKSQFDFPIEIVIAGGTSMPKGFVNKIEDVVKDLKLPFKIKKVRHSSDPRNSVVKGCLIQAMVAEKKLAKSEDLDLES
jgi:hypothetical protein